MNTRRKEFFTRLHALNALADEIFGVRIDPSDVITDWTVEQLSKLSLDQLLALQENIVQERGYYGYLLSKVEKAIRRKRDERSMGLLS